MLLSHRDTDAVIAVYQDNDQEQITIHDLNPTAESMLGYQKDELKGQSLSTLLPERIDSLLKEYVEYDTYGNDVGNVLNKVSSFCVLNKAKEEISLRVKVQRSTPIDGFDQFNLILQVVQSNRRSEAFRELLKENFKGHEVLDEETGLPNRASLEKDIELVMFYVNKKELNASIAVVDLDDLDKHQKRYDEAGVSAILKHIALLCRQNLRGDDTVGLVGPGRIGLILFDATNEAAKMVLNRLRWLVAANGCIMADEELASLSVRVAYMALQPDSTDTQNVIHDLETSLDSGDVSSNHIIQLNTD